jgi:hypothetical protein
MLKDYEGQCRKIWVILLANVQEAGKVVQLKLAKNT